MPDKGNKILRYIPGEKSLKVPFIIYADLECLLKKINTCSNNPKKLYTEKKATHQPSGYSLVTFCSFDKSKNERKYCRGEDCMKMFYKDLKDQAMKIINYEKKEMTPLTNEEKESYENQKVCYINEFALLLGKGVYPYEYMDSWERFKEESLTDKESFYSELNNEHITDEDYAHAQKVWRTFNIKKT